MNYIAEVQTAGNGDTWSTNNLTFETYEEAEQYVKDLFTRWTSVTEWRIRAVAQPVNCKLNPDGTREHL
jgi:hypothetical protein